MRRAAGFTLLELLVSVFLLSVLSAFAYGTLSYVRKSREATDDAFERTRALQLAVRTLVTDFQQLEPRPIREPLGDASQPSLRADRRAGDVVTLTRGGWSNTAGLPRGTLQRVSYQLEDGALYRQYTTVLDATLANAPVRRRLLEDVSSVTIRYLDGTRQWQEQWPGLDTTSAANAPLLRSRPVAVEITLELEDLGRIVRLVEVPG